MLKLLEKRFGPLDNAYHQRIEAATVEQLEAWGERILDAQTAEEVFCK
ncbi:DUF4351 domain-containing protein [Marinimicrobium locisalis]